MCFFILYANLNLLLILQIPNGQSDTEFLSETLCDKTETHILDIFSAIKGPWSVIFYHKKSSHLYFGRDIIGRHSLLWSERRITISDFNDQKNLMCIRNGVHNDDNNSLPDDGFKSNYSKNKQMIITSVGDGSNNFEEIPALGIYSINLKNIILNETIPINLFPWNSVSLLDFNLADVKIMDRKLLSPITVSLRKSLPTDHNLKLVIQQSTNYQDFDTLASNPLFDSNYTQFIHLLTQAINRRVEACPPLCLLCSRQKTDAVTGQCDHSPVAVLFSGGLDSAVLALLLDRCLPKYKSIDLVNVAFPQKMSQQNIRLKKKKTKLKEPSTDNQLIEPVLNEMTERTELLAMAKKDHYDVPDRLTGRTTLEQLRMLCPNRTFNFIEVSSSHFFKNIGHQTFCLHAIFYCMSCIIVIIYHDFLSTSRRGSNVKSDKTHTHSHQDTPLRPYT